MRPALRDRRLWLLAGALVCAGIALAGPRWAVTRPSYRVVVVLDITGSMNTRDQKIAERSASRLDFAKLMLRRAIGGLPCRSQVGLALFTERRSFLLMEPVEMCADISTMDGAIAGIDWRMAWEGDSHIGAGLRHGLELAGSLDADLLFLTDGQEAPPLPENWEERFEAPGGPAKGLIAGVGGYVLAPIPKFDATGRETGFYNADDVPHESRIGAPPKGAESREGWHPRNAPYGAAAAQGSEHLSSLREDHLKRLAGKTGLAYAHLETPEGLVQALAASARSRLVHVGQDISALPAAAALALLLAAYLPGPAELIAQLRARARISPRKGMKP